MSEEARGHVAPRRQQSSSATMILSWSSQHQLDNIALRLNTRPRMTLGYRTPADKLTEIVASMG